MKNYIPYPLVDFEEMYVLSAPLSKYLGIFCRGRETQLYRIDPSFIMEFILYPEANQMGAFKGKSLIFGKMHKTMHKDILAPTAQLATVYLLQK